MIQPPPPPAETPPMLVVLNKVDRLDAAVAAQLQVLSRPLKQSSGCYICVLCIASCIEIL